MKILQDKFTRGFVAGFLGGVAATAINLPLYLLGIAKFRLMDFVSHLVYGYFPKTPWEIAFGFLLHWGFAGVASALFVTNLVKLVDEDNFIFKTWLFGVGIWFTVYVITFLFKVKALMVIPFPTAIVNFTASSAFGIVMGLVFKFLEKKYTKTSWK